MLKEPEAKTFAQGEAQVLILILMEHAQRVFNCWHDWARYSVLILILMEHAQRGYNLLSKMLKLDVLILILMEHAQRVRFNHDPNTMEVAS